MHRYTRGLLATDYQVENNLRAWSGQCPCMLSERSRMVLSRSSWIQPYSLQSTLTHFSLTGHLHHNRKYLLRETWFRPGQLLHLLYIAPSPDSRVLFFKSLQGTEQMWFFFFLMFSWKAFLFQPWMNTNHHKTSFISTEAQWGWRNTGTLQALRGVKTNVPII